MMSLDTVTRKVGESKSTKEKIKPFEKSQGAAPETGTVPAKPETVSPETETATPATETESSKSEMVTPEAEAARKQAELEKLAAEMGIKSGAELGYVYPEPGEFSGISIRYSDNDRRDLVQTYPGGRIGMGQNGKPSRMSGVCWKGKEMEEVDERHRKEPSEQPGMTPDKYHEYVRKQLAKPHPGYTMAALTPVVIRDKDGSRSILPGFRKDERQPFYTPYPEIASANPPIYPEYAYLAYGAKKPEPEKSARSPESKLPETHRESAEALARYMPWILRRAHRLPRNPELTPETIDKAEQFFKDYNWLYYDVVGVLLEAQLLSKATLYAVKGEKDPAYWSRRYCADPNKIFEFTGNNKLILLKIAEEVKYDFHENAPDGEHSDYIDSLIENAIQK